MSEVFPLSFNCQTRFILKADLEESLKAAVVDSKDLLPERNVAKTQQHGMKWTT